MTIVKLLFAVLVGLYAVAQGVFFVTLLRGRHTPMDLAASGAIMCVALAISLGLFGSAFKKPRA